MFYLFSWYATPEKFSSHWYTFYKCLHGNTQRDDVRVLCREDLAHVKHFHPVLTKFGFRRSFIPFRKRNLKRCLEQVKQKVLERDKAKVVFAYEGGVRELQTILGLAKLFPESKHILNFFDLEQWEEAFNRNGFARKLVVESLKHGVLFTCEFPARLPFELRRILPDIPALPLFTSISQMSEGQGAQNRNILVLFKSFADIRLHEADLMVLSNEGWELRIEGQRDYVLLNGSNLHATGDHPDHDSYHRMLTSNSFTLFLYDPTKFVRKSSGKLEDVISVQSTPVVPRGSALEIQNGRNLQSYEWTEPGSIVRAMEQLISSPRPGEPFLTPANFLNFLESLPHHEGPVKEFPQRPWKLRGNINLRIMDRGHLGDYANAILVWTGLSRIFRLIRSCGYK